ncbi:hypothetical protein GCM10010428_60960 [Actinosynnema pretiosum subsp. pretiosum]
MRIGGKVVAFLGLSAAAVLLSALVTGVLVPVEDGQPWPVVAVAAGLVLLATRWFEGAWRGLGPGRWFGPGLLLGVAAVGLLAWGLMLDGVLRWTPNAGFTAPLALTGTAYFCFAVLLEELVFRGYALRRLAEVWGPKVAVGGLAVLFGGYHLLVLGAAPSVKSGGFGELLWTAAGPAIGAVVFGVAALRTGGIALPVGLHLGWNWAQWQFFAFPTDDNPVGRWTPLVTPGVDPVVFKVGYVVVMALVLGAVLLVTRRREPRGRAVALPA